MALQILPAPINTNSTATSPMQLQLLLSLLHREARIWLKQYLGAYQCIHESRHVQT